MNWLFSGSPRICQAKIIWIIIGAVYLYIWSLPLWKNYEGKGIGTAEVKLLLRDPGQVKWYLITFFMIVMYIVFDEIQRGNIKAVLAASAFLLTDFFNAIWNSLFYTATGYAAVWQISGTTAFLGIKI